MYLCMCVHTLMYVMWKLHIDIGYLLIAFHLIFKFYFYILNSVFINSFKMSYRIVFFSQINFLAVLKIKI